MRTRFFLPLGLVLTLHLYGQEPEPKTIPEIVKEEGSFYSAGAIADSFYGMSFANAPPDLKKLISMSELIVKCAVLEAKPHLSKTQREIFTDYKVGVQDILYDKSHDPVPQTVEICLLGGKMQFPEGWAEYEQEFDYPNSVHPIAGQTFILFLAKTDQHPDKFAPVDISLGIFLLKDEKILPASPEKEPLHRNYKGKDVFTFIDEIKAIAATPAE